MLNKISLIMCTGLLLSACGASTPNVNTAEVKDNKEKISKCMKKNEENGEDCVSKESVAKTGLVCKREAITGTRLAKEYARQPSSDVEKLKPPKGWLSICKDVLLHPIVASIC